MNERQVPDLRTVAFAAAVWFAGLAVAFVLQVPEDPSVTVAWRGILIGLSLFGSYQMFRIGKKLGDSEAVSTTAVREAIRRIDRSDRAA